MKIHPHKANALALYLSGMEVKEISGILPVKEETIYNWKKKGNWVSLREQSQADATLKYLEDLLKKEMERSPENAPEIKKHLAAVYHTFMQPRDVLRNRILHTLTELENLLHDNLI